MDDQVPMPTVVIPAPENFCNLVVFPSTTSMKESKFFLLKNKADVPQENIGNVKVEFVPGSIYCLLPSKEKSIGCVSVYESKPSFLDSYAYSLEINVKSVDFFNCKFDDKIKEPNMNEAFETSKRSEKCERCFLSHFPSPNSLQCKYKKKKENDTRKFPIRLRGGANSEPGNMIERAIENAKAHGINIHAGVQNLGNGNCVFESIIDSINMRSIYQETIEGTPDYWRGTVSYTHLTLPTILLV